MSINKTAVLAQIKSAMDEYGYPVQIFRDIYETDAIGCERLTEPYKFIGTLQCLIDNSKSERQKSVINNNKGVILNSSVGTLYAPYDINIPLQVNDWIEVDGVKYRVKEISDTLHYHLLWTIQLERVEIDG